MAQSGAPIPTQPAPSEPVTQGRRMTETQHATIARLIERGKSDTEIAAIMGCARATINRLRKPEQKRQNPRQLAPEVREEICARLARGEPDQQIADALGVDRSTVYRYRVPRPGRRRTSWVDTVPKPAFIEDQNEPRPYVAPLAADGLPHLYGRALLDEVFARLRAKIERAPAARTAPAPVLESAAPEPYRPRKTCTLSSTEARTIVTRLEGSGWRAEHITHGDGTAYVEVRDLAKRAHPLVATLRTQEDAKRFLDTCGHGLAGRVASPESLGIPGPAYDKPTKAQVAKKGEYRQPTPSDTSGDWMRASVLLPSGSRHVTE